MAELSATAAPSAEALASAEGAAPHDRVSARSRGRHRLARYRGLIYVAPAAIVYGLFAIWPTLSTLRMSFFTWDGVLPETWAGLDNYVRIFTKPELLSSIGHSLVLIAFFSIAPVCVGLLMTGLLIGKVRRGMPFFRTVFFLPQVLPLVAVGITWRWLYSEDGMVNQALTSVGLGDLTRAWLGDYDLALVALGLIGTWTMSGLCMMLFLSGAQKIDPAYYEAATLDGAGAVRQFTAVTLPGLRNEVTIATVITTIAALASFDLVFVTTNGGPAGQTNVPGLLVFRLAFNEGNFGGAAALAIALSVIVIAAVSLIRFVAKERA
ncbi:carbohydrate ABC transporter permease [Microbacterium tumbae]